MRLKDISYVRLVDQPEPPESAGAATGREAILLIYVAEGVFHAAVTRAQG